VTRLAWLTPMRLALASAVVVALLLFLPIRILGAGDHEKQSCGNAVSMNLRPWYPSPTSGEPNAGYFDQAFKSCTSVRIDRLSEAVIVMVLTLLGVTALSRRRREEPAVPRDAR